MQQHEKIINQVTKNVLATQGLFRKGSSRIWLEDNDYFFIQIEFQASGYSKGTYLNAGVGFLWEYTDNMNTLLAFNYGYRIKPKGKQFIEYTGNDELFLEEVESFANEALNKVIEYRKFKDLEYAKKILIKETTKNEFWNYYNLAMLCFLKKDFQEGKTFFHRFLELLKEAIYVEGIYIEWHDEFYKYCMEAIVPQCTNQESAYKMVVEMIQRRRSYFNSKVSFKKMKKELFLGME